MTVGRLAFRGSLYLIGDDVLEPPYIDGSILKATLDVHQGSLSSLAVLTHGHIEISPM